MLAPLTWRGVVPAWRSRILPRPRLSWLPARLPGVCGERLVMRPLMSGIGPPVAPCCGLRHRRHVLRGRMSRNCVRQGLPVRVPLNELWSYTSVAGAWRLEGDDAVSLTNHQSAGAATHIVGSVIAPSQNSLQSDRAEAAAGAGQGAIPGDGPEAFVAPCYSGLNNLRNGVVDSVVPWVIYAPAGGSRH